MQSTVISHLEKKKNYILYVKIMVGELLSCKQAVEEENGGPEHGWVLMWWESNKAAALQVVRNTGISHMMSSV